jgi:hypothetical protein
MGVLCDSIASQFGYRFRSTYKFNTGNTLLPCYTYHSVNSSIVLTRLSGLRSRTTTCQKIW